MTAVGRVAVVGCGVSALAAAIALAKGGVEVEVFEQKPELSALGSGISLQTNAMRVFDALGVWGDVRAAGCAFDGLVLRAPGPDAAVVMRAPEGRGGEYPSGMGMPRTELARILFDHAKRAGAAFRFGAEVTGVRSEDTEAFVAVGGEEITGPYDLVIGADGLHSAVRAAVGILTRPEPTGMGIWRAFVSRPEEVTTTELYYGGPAYIAGYTPTGEDSMYAFLVEDARNEAFEASAAEGARAMHGLSAGYGGPWESIRADLQRGAPVNYTRFTAHLVEEPWHSGRAVIIGDAAHSCPPTIAQGAAQALEDALVLTELLLGRDAVDESLWREFAERRLPRVRAVVEASVQLADWQREGARDADMGGLLGGLAAKMAEPA